MSYAGQFAVTSDVEPHLGGNINHGDPHTFAPLVVDYLIGRFALRSMLDLGSGQGHTASLFNKKGIIAIACDGLEQNVNNNVYPTVACDFSKSAFICSVDLVWCQEVAEHVDEKYIDFFIRSLSCGKIIVMTHAVPGQDGYNHVNCKDTQYWIDSLAKVGYVLSVVDSNRVRELALKDGAQYLARTGMVLLRQ